MTTRKGQHPDTFCDWCGVEISVSTDPKNEGWHYHYVTHFRGCPRSEFASWWQLVLALFGYAKIYWDLYEMEVVYFRRHCVRRKR